MLFVSFLGCNWLWLIELVALKPTRFSTMMLQCEYILIDNQMCLWTGSLAVVAFVNYTATGFLGIAQTSASSVEECKNTFVVANFGQGYKRKKTTFLSRGGLSENTILRFSLPVNNNHVYIISLTPQQVKCECEILCVCLRVMCQCHSPWQLPQLLSAILYAMRSAVL